MDFIQAQMLACACWGWHGYVEYHYGMPQPCRLGEMLPAPPMFVVHGVGDTWEDAIVDALRRNAPGGIIRPVLAKGA